MSAYILPRIPSKLIRLALEDLAKAESMPDKYRVDMNRWYLPGSAEGLVLRQDNRCALCFAGAIMEMRLDAANVYARTKSTEELKEHKVIPYLYIGPDQFPGNHDALHALNCLRLGAIAEAFSRLRIDEDPPFDHVCVRCYNPDNGVSFRKDMAELADDLEARGF